MKIRKVSSNVSQKRYFTSYLTEKFQEYFVQSCVIALIEWKQKLLVINFNYLREASSKASIVADLGSVEFPRRTLVASTCFFLQHSGLSLLFKFPYRKTSKLVEVILGKRILSARDDFTMELIRHCWVVIYVSGHGKNRSWLTVNLCLE